MKKTIAIVLMTLAAPAAANAKDCYYWRSDEMFRECERENEFEKRMQELEQRQQERLKEAEKRQEERFEQLKRKQEEAESEMRGWELQTATEQAWRDIDASNARLHELSRR